MLYAIALNRTARGFELGEIEEIDGKDIRPDDGRILSPARRISTGSPRLYWRR